MKKKKRENRILTILLVSSAVLLALLLFQIMKGRENQEEAPSFQEEESEASKEEEAETEEATQQTEPQTEGEEAAEEQTGYIIIGDSHVVVTDGQGYGMLGSTVEGVTYKENLFFVHTGLDPVMGTLDWLKGDGADSMRALIDRHTEIQKWNIISIHGTSMTALQGMEDRYVEVYRQWIDETFRDCDVYFVSVPPLDEEEWVTRHPDMIPRYNQDIIDFNTKIKETFPDHYFDYYDWFVTHDDFQDEIHYTGETYRNMFDEIIAKINA